MSKKVVIMSNREVLQKLRDIFHDLRKLETNMKEVPTQKALGKAQGHVSDMIYTVKRRVSYHD